MCNVKRSGEWLNKAPKDCCVKSGEVEPGVRVTSKNTELVKIISTIANTNDVGHRNNYLLDYPLSRRCVLDLGVFHHGRAPLQHLRVVEDARVLRRVVGVASIPIAMQVVCTSTMALSCFVRETSHFVLVGIHRGTFWNGHIVLRQVRQAHTEHHDCRVEASVVRDFRARVVVVCTAGFGVDPERKGCL